MSENLAEWPRGTQVLYVPGHANGNERHPDVQAGFVWRDSGGAAVFVRYFAKGNPDVLRTRANSESTPRDMLVLRQHHTPEEIAGWVGYIEAAEAHAAMTVWLQDAPLMSLKRLRPLTVAILTSETEPRIALAEERALAENADIVLRWQSDDRYQVLKHRWSQINEVIPAAELPRWLALQRERYN